MTLIVENGTGVESANTYADITTVRLYAESRGFTLPPDPNLQYLIIKSMDYLDGVGLGLLSINFPLEGNLFCGRIKITEVIDRLSNALSQLCIEQLNGVDLSPTRTTAFIAEERVDVITTKYSTEYSGGAGSYPIMLTVESLLKPLLGCINKGELLTVVRA